MRIVSWNMNYWQNTHIFNPKNDRFKSPFFKNSIEEINTWIDSCKKYIQELNVDIIVLQEINPFTLYGIKYDKNDHNQYKVIYKSEIILYHELYNELSNENLKENFWGNAIIINNNNISFIKNNLSQEANEYYGQNGLMSYDFSSKNGTGITIFNYYNKKNRNKKYYSMPYDIKNDLKNILIDKNENVIIFAGDFNSDKDKDLGNRKFFKFVDEVGFINYTEGDEFDNTMVPEARPYPNDKVYIKNMNNVKQIICKLLKNTNNSLSDHYPVLCEIVEK